MKHVVSEAELEEQLKGESLNLDTMVEGLSINYVTDNVGNGARAWYKIDQAESVVAISISGGGASGAYEAGALEALLHKLQEKGIKVSLIVGTSAGALNALGLLYEQLGIQAELPPTSQTKYTHFVANLWEYLDRKHNASKHVVGPRAWLVRLLTQWAKSELIMRVLLLAAALIVLGAIQPVLAITLWNVTTRGMSFWDSFTQGILLALNQPWIILVIGFGCLLALLILGIVAWIKFKYSAFPNKPLLRLLANCSSLAAHLRKGRRFRPFTREIVQGVSQQTVDLWYKRMEEFPEFILTGTNISLKSDTLFTLVKPKTYKKLLEAEWMAIQLMPRESAIATQYNQPNALFSEGWNFLDCVLLSTSIPGVFPASQVGYYTMKGQRRHNNFVDGGVLNNSPIHIAIDAGATHVISLELSPITPPDTESSKWEKPREKPTLFETCTRTLSTLLSLATNEDIRKSSSWNRYLLKNPPTTDKRRLVQIYRVAPSERLIDTMEFNGHYASIWKREVSLSDWLLQGKIDLQARDSRAIWRATLKPNP